MTGRKRKGSAPMALRWFAALQEADVPRDNPGRVSVIAVASTMMSHADGDGRSCYPSIPTIIKKAGVSERTVRLVLRWLVDDGWLAVAAKANQRRPTTYRLTIPEDAEEHPLDDAPEDAEEHPLDHPGDALGDAAGDAEEHPDLQPPSYYEEEEEGACARSADAALAAPQLPTPVNPFRDEWPEPDPEPSVAPSSPPPIEEVEVDRLVRGIAMRSVMSLDVGKVGPAFAKALGGVEWRPEVLAVHCIETLKLVRPKSPTGFLVTHLATRVNAGVTMTPRMELAGLLEELNDLDDECDVRDEELGGFSSLIYLEELAERSGLPMRSGGGFPLLWDVKPADLDGYLRVARRAVLESEQRLRPDQS